MNEKDKEKFAEMFTGLAEYYNKEISQILIGIYWKGLERFDIDSIISAIDLHVQNPESGNFFPKISDLNKYIHGSTSDNAQLAWTKVDHAIRMIGTEETVIFDDPIIHAVIDNMGGWISFGNKSEKEWPFVANEFRQRYSGYKERGGQCQYPGKLIGIDEAQNSGKFKADWYEKRKLSVPQPVIIGDKEKALLVLKGRKDTPIIEFYKNAESLNG